MNSKKQRGQGYVSRTQMLEMLPRHEKFSPILLDQLAKIPDEILENRASEWAAKLYRMSRQVGREYDKCRAFTRTHLNPHGILWSIINIDHKVEDLVLQYFHKRFPKYIIALYNQKSKLTHICYESGMMDIKTIYIQDIIANLETNRPLCEIIPGETFDCEQLSKENKELYRVFYQSQYIAERDNPRYFQQMMPKKWREAPGLEMERGFLNNTLDKFVGEKNDRKINKSNSN